jgi:hypothetical protein
MQKAIALTKNAPESGWRPRRSDEPSLVGLRLYPTPHETWRTVP